MAFPSRAFYEPQGISLKDMPGWLTRYQPLDPLGAFDRYEQGQQQEMRTQMGELQLEEAQRERAQQLERDAQLEEFFKSDPATRDPKRIQEILIGTGEYKPALDTMKAEDAFKRMLEAEEAKQRIKAKYRTGPQDPEAMYYDPADLTKEPVVVRKSVALKEGLTPGKPKPEKESTFERERRLAEERKAKSLEEQGPGILQEIISQFSGKKSAAAAPKNAATSSPGLPPGAVEVSVDTPVAPGMNKGRTKDGRYFLVPK